MRVHFNAVLLAVCGCAAGPGAGPGLMPAERTTVAIEEVPGPEGGEISTERVAVDMDLAEQGLEGLVGTLGRLVAPGTWGPPHGTALYADGDAIVVRHSPAARKAVRSVLTALAGAENRVLTVRARALELSPGQFAAIGWTQSAEGGLADVYDRAELEHVVERWKKDGETQILSAPRLTILAGRPGTITISNQVAYVRGYERTTGDGATVWDPVVGTVSEGLALDVCALPNGFGSDTMLLRFSVDFDRLFDRRDEIPTVRQGTLVTELPRVSHSRLAATLAVRPGQAVLAVVAAPPTAGDEPRLLALFIEPEWDK